MNLSSLLGSAAESSKSRRDCLRQCVNQVCLYLQQNLQNHEEKLPTAVCQSGLLVSAEKFSKSRRETAYGSVSIRSDCICSKIFKITKRNCLRQCANQFCLNLQQFLKSVENPKVQLRLEGPDVSSKGYF